MRYVFTALVAVAVLLALASLGGGQTTTTPQPATGSWFYLHGDYTAEDLGPGDFDVNADDLDHVTEFTVANGTFGYGDPSVLFLRMIDHPGYVYLFGSSGQRWAYYEFEPGGIVNNGRSFTFRVRPLDAQIHQFRDGERVWFDFHFWPN